MTCNNNNCCFCSGTGSEAHGAGVSSTSRRSAWHNHQFSRNTGRLPAQWRSPRTQVWIINPYYIKQVLQSSVRLRWVFSLLLSVALYSRRTLSWLSPSWMPCLVSTSGLRYWQRYSFVHTCIHPCVHIHVFCDRFFACYLRSAGLSCPGWLLCNWKTFLLWSNLSYTLFQPLMHMRSDIESYL